MGLELQWSLAGFFLGVAIRSLIPIPWWFGLLVFFVSLLGAFHARSCRKAKQFILFGIVFIGLSLGIIRADITESRAPKHIFDQYLGRSVEFTGVVSALPQERGQVLRTLIRPDGAKLMISLSVPLYPNVRYGDRLRVAGTLLKPEAFLTDNGRTFNYPQYLALDDAYYQLKNVRATVVGHDAGNWFKQKLFDLRTGFLSRLSERFAAPESALIAGLLIGEKSSLGRSLEEAFRKAGVIHIVVLSGFNVTIIGQAVMYLLSGLPRRASIFSGIGFIILFSIMTGGTATVVRSAIMAVVALIAALHHRTYDVSRALFFAAFLMVCFDPRILMFDPSFQLSFLSTVGLIYLSPMFERRLMRCPEMIRVILVATLSTQLFVLPYLLFSMGDISVVSVAANLAILPVIPIAMLFGFVSVVLPGFIAFVPVVLASLLLKYIFAVVHFFADLPFATIAIPYFPAWLMITWYGITGYLLWWKYGRETKK